MRKNVAKILAGVLRSFSSIYRRLAHFIEKIFFAYTYFAYFCRRAAALEVPVQELVRQEEYNQSKESRI